MESHDTAARLDDTGLRRPRRHAVVWLQLLGLLALLTPLFASIGAFVASDGAPTATAPATPETAPVVLAVPVERVVERIVYVQPNAPTGTTARESTVSSPTAQVLAESAVAPAEPTEAATETAEDSALGAADEDNAPAAALALAPIPPAPREVRAAPAAPARVISPPVPVYAPAEDLEASDEAEAVEDEASLTALLPDDSVEEEVWDEPSQEVAAEGRTEIVALVEVPGVSLGNGEQGPSQILMMTGSVVSRPDDDLGESSGEDAEGSDSTSADDAGEPEDGVGELASADDHGPWDGLVAAMDDQGEDELARAPLADDGEGSDDGLSDDLTDDGSGIDQIEVLLPAGG